MDCLHTEASHDNPPLIAANAVLPLTHQMSGWMSRAVIHPPSPSHLSSTSCTHSCQVINLFVLPNIVRLRRVEWSKWRLEGKLLLWTIRIQAEIFALHPCLKPIRIQIKLGSLPQSKDLLLGLTPTHTQNKEKSINLNSHKPRAEFHPNPETCFYIFLRIRENIHAGGGFDPCQGDLSIFVSLVLCNKK